MIEGLQEYRKAYGLGVFLGENTMRRIVPEPILSISSTSPVAGPEMQDRICYRHATGEVVGAKSLEKKDWGETAA